MEETKNHLSEQSTKGFAKSTKDQKLNVYVWDMDETIILLKSLLHGTYAKAFSGSKDVKKGEELGRLWEKQILDMCDNRFFYEQIENYNQPFIDALSQYDDGRDLSNYDFDQDGFGPPCDDGNKRKLAYRQRAITNKYKEGLQNIFDEKKKKHWEELYEMTDVYTDRWFSSARSFLEECSFSDKPPLASGDQTCSSTSRSSQHVNVLVTSGALIPCLVKCLLFRFDHLITPGNVYSSWEVGKVQCFQWIKERFDKPNVRFCAIGDGWEECEAAQSLKWPFVKIDLQPGSPHRFPGFQSQIMCSGCKNLLIHPAGATSICCALCHTVSPVPTSGSAMARLVCSGCHTLLLYSRGATSVRCCCCCTVNAASKANEMGHIKCGNCRVVLMYQCGSANCVKCTLCNFVTSLGT